MSKLMYLNTENAMDQCCNEDWKWTEDEYEDSLVSENRPKTNTKNLRQFKNSSKIANSLNIFKDMKIFEGKWKILLLHVFFQAATWTNFPSSTLYNMWGKLKFKFIRKVHIFRLFQTILSIILLNFPKKSSQSMA